MNILIVNENYTRGGLETHLYTQFEAMKDSHKFVFAMGRYETNLKFENCKVYENFHFTPSVTIKEFCEDVNRLMKIIEEEKIDVIHAHPFYSVFQAVFAAKLMNKPVVYTLHGVASFNFPSQVNDTILYYTMLESEIDKIYGVSNLCVTAVNNAIFSNKATWLPNAINVKKYRKNEIINNKKWALISRLSYDKLKEIQQLLSIVNEIDIEQIDIYGDSDGDDYKNYLQEYINQNNLQDKVKLLGHCDNLYEVLDGKYNGVIGIGRVVIEAICMGYPTLLIGYGKIAGIIDKNVYDLIKYNNFINKMLPDISPNELNNQLQKVYTDNKEDLAEISDLLRNEFDNEKVYDNYVKDLEGIKINSTIDIKRIYKEICAIENHEENFYGSREVYKILKIYIENQCTSLYIKTLFCNNNNYYKLSDENYRNLENIASSIDEINSRVNKIADTTKELFTEEIEDINKRMQEVQDKINIKFLAHNTIDMAKNRKKF